MTENALDWSAIDFDQPDSGQVSWPISELPFPSPGLIGAARVRSSDPDLAANALSSENFVFKNFNQPLIASRSDTDTDTTLASDDDFVLADAESIAFLRLDETVNQDFGAGSVINQVIVNGEALDGFATGSSAIAGTFLIEAGETFSFEFAAYLELKTRLQDAKDQVANALGRIAFGVYDVTRAPVRLDYLSLEGGLDTPGNQDFLNFQITGSSIQLNSQTTTFSRQTGGLEESTFVAIVGQYSSQIFQQDTLLVLGDFGIG